MVQLTISAAQDSSHCQGPAELSSDAAELFNRLGFLYICLRKLVGWATSQLSLFQDKSSERCTHFDGPDASAGSEVKHPLRVLQRRRV